MELAAPSRRERLRDVRRWWRVTVPSPSLGQRADAVYTVLLTAAIFGSVAFNAAHTALSEVLSVGGVATWAPAVLALILVVVARWGAYQGPVVYRVADVAHLLGAPLSRRGLAQRKLTGALVGGALVGATLGSVLLVGLGGDGAGLSAARGAGLLGALALVGVLGVSGAWAVQASPRFERVLGPLGWLVLVLGIGVGVLGSRSGDVLSAERWSGPWGWASAPVQAGAWGLPLALLAAMTAACAVLALSRCGRCATERHVRRAEARAGAAASLAAFDARSTRRALDTAAAPRAANSGRGLLRRGAAPTSAAAPSAAAAARPGARVGGAAASRRTAARRLAAARPPLLLAWRGSVALRRTPGRVAEAVVLAGAAAALLVTAGDRPTAALAAGLLAYVAATRVLEPLRQEVDAPGRALLLLRGTWGRTLAGHVVLPAALLAGAALVAGVACAAAGAGASSPAGVVLTAVLGVPTAALAAALSARRGGRLSQTVLTLANSDASGAGSFLVIGWVLAFPLLGAAAAAGPSAMVALGGAGLEPIALALAALVAFLLYAVLVASERP